MNSRYPKLLLKILTICVISGTGLYYSVKYNAGWDFSQQQRHTLSQETLDIISALEVPLNIYAFARPTNNAKRRYINETLQRYRTANPNISVEFLDPDTELEWIRKYGDLRENQIILEANNQVEIAASLFENDIASAILRIARPEQHYVVFLSGHGEGSPFEDGKRDFRQFADAAKAHGFNIQQINLAKIKQLPSNTKLVVLTSGTTDYLRGEVSIIREFINGGGNLLWLADPSDDLKGLELLAEDFALETLPGVIVDTKTSLLGINDPSFLIVDEYAQHPTLQAIQSQTTLFPGSMALFAESSVWDAMPLLNTDENTWTETSPLQGEIFFAAEDDEQSGPLNFGYVFTKEPTGANNVNISQRAIVIGDSDFISNGFLDNGANQQLGLNLLNWLSNTDGMINIQLPQAGDKQLSLSTSYQISLFLIFFVAIPLAFVGMGFFLWMQRRN